MTDDPICPHIDLATHDWRLWIDPACRYCTATEPCLTHDRRPRTLAQNRVIFGPSFGYEPTEADRIEAVLGYCVHGVNLDREFCPAGCRV